MVNRYYIGLAATFHDPAIAILDENGAVLFAEATERHLQDKRALCSLPDHSIRAPQLIRQYCAPDADLVLAVSWSQRALDSLSAIVLDRVGPFAGALQHVVDYVSAFDDFLFWPFPSARGLRTSMFSSLMMAGNSIASDRSISNPISFRRLDHHLAHAAYACYSSPFTEALCAVVDGSGEWTSTNFYWFENGKIAALQEQRSCRNPQMASLGMFYSKLCGWCGFDVLKGEEWKVMGLAPYGKVDRRLYDFLKPMIRANGLDLTSDLSPDDYRCRMAEMQRRIRKPGSSPLEAADLACTGQEIFAETMSDLLNYAYRMSGSENLVLGGGCALNSSFNGRILAGTPFRRLHVPSAPGDDGNAIGAAMVACRQDGNLNVTGRRLSPYSGSDIAREGLENLAEFSGLKKLRHLPGRIVPQTARILAGGGIVGWVQGRAEFGPRALGNRSIVADPRPAGMKDKINARVKFREEFRPFAPSILNEYGPEYFEDYQESPYMERTLVFREKVRDCVPAVVHEDGTGRVQSVTLEMNPLYYDLIDSFRKLTGTPLLLNTSFNVMGKPIIHTVEDAVAVFFTSGLDAMAIGDWLLEK